MALDRNSKKKEAFWAVFKEAALEIVETIPPIAPLASCWCSPSTGNERWVKNTRLEQVFSDIAPLQVSEAVEVVWVNRRGQKHRAKGLRSPADAL